MANLSPFGQQLRRWRRARGLSQLQLALRATVSARHVSFVETGRSRPSERIVLQLAEALSVPLRERNALFRAAGLPPRYPERALSAPEMSAAKQLLSRMLDKHEPYPALVIDRWWYVVDANRAAKTLFAELASLDQPVYAVRTLLGPGPYRTLIDNYAEVAWATVARMRREVVAAGQDERLRSRLALAEELIADVPRPLLEAIDSPVIATRIRMGNQVIRTVSAIASFGAAHEVTLNELRIELVYPADLVAEDFFRQLADSRLNAH